MEEVFGAAGTFTGAGSLLRKRTPVIASVTLAPLEELREQARGSVLLGQLATLVDEVGTSGRSLTKTGRCLSRTHASWSGPWAGRRESRPMAPSRPPPSTALPVSRSHHSGGSRG
ncbi:hypothetical protein [Streptomyces niveus]|uniref:hypothetical protein n=1 Tax=Streptomyces niveus TaxID=193462 RepID=UPI0033E0EF22